MMSTLFLQGPSLLEIESSLAGLDIEEVEKVLSVVQRDLEERQFVVNEGSLEKKDSMKELGKMVIKKDSFRKESIREPVAACLRRRRSSVAVRCLIVN